MTAKTPRENLTSLRSTILEDLAATSDSDLRREAEEDKNDVVANANQLRSSVREAIASSLRARLATARDRAKISLERNPRYVRPTIDRIKRVVEAAIVREPELALAFRNAKHPSDVDWQTLYDDLLALGALRPEDDAD